MSIPATRTITLEVCGLGTLALGVDLINIPSVSAAKWRPGEVVPSDLSATFRVHRSRRVCDMLLRTPDAVLSIADPVAWDDESITIVGAGLLPPTPFAAWIGAEKVTVTDWSVQSDRPWTFLDIDRGVDDTRQRAVYVSALTEGDRRPVPDVLRSMCVGTPGSLSGLRAIYRLHREDGTTRVLLDGVIRSMRDSGDLIEISVATNLGEIGEQAWPSIACNSWANEPDDWEILPPGESPPSVPLATPVWIDNFNSMARSETSSTAHPIGRVAPAGLSDPPFTYPAPPRVPLLAVGYPARASKILPSAVTPYAQEGRDMRQQLASLSRTQGLGGDVLAYQSHTGAHAYPYRNVRYVCYPLVDDIKTRKFTATVRHPLTAAPQTVKCTFSMANSPVDEYYALLSVDPIEPDDPLCYYVPAGETYGITRNHSFGSGEYEGAGRSNQMGPLYAAYRYTTGGLGPGLDSGSWEAWTKRARWFFRLRKSGVSNFEPERRGWVFREDAYQKHLCYAKDRVLLCPWVATDLSVDFGNQIQGPSFFRSAPQGIPAEYIDDSYSIVKILIWTHIASDLRCDLSDAQLAVRSTATMYRTASETSEVWPPEMWEGRKIKDTFFKDQHYQYALEWTWGANGKLRPIYLGAAFPASTAVRIDERVLLDGDATVQFDYSFALRSVTMEAASDIVRLQRDSDPDDDEYRVVQRSYPQKTTFLPKSVADSGVDVTIGGTVYAQRSHEPIGTAAKYITHRDAATAVWRRAVRNYGAPYPTVTLRVRERVAAYPGTFVRIDHPTMSGPNGAVGVTDLLAQVLERGDDVENGTAEIQLLLVGWPV